MDNEQKLYNEEVRQLLIDIKDAIKRQETKVSVDAPNVTVEPTPVVVEKQEVVIDTSDLKNALQGVTDRLNKVLAVKVSNPQAQIDKIEVKNLQEMERLLKDLVDKETVINVDTKAAQVNVTFPTSANPKEYIPVRLTDGDQFYNAISALVKGSSLSATAKSNLESLSFTEDNRLEVDANFSGEIDIGDVQVKNVAGTKINPSTEEKQDELIDDIADVTSTNTHTSSKEVRVYQENHICTQNTTSTPLGAGATFTGEWQDCLQYQEVNVSIVASHNSATNGLVIQWSADGINVGDTDTFSYYAANGGTNYTPNPAFRYVRLVYTNGATPQSSFNLMTILRRSVTGGSFHRIDSTLKDDADARLNITVPKLKTAANTYVSMQGTTAGNAKMSLEEMETDVESFFFNNMAEWGMNDLEEASATVTYVGYERSDGSWNVIKIDTTTGYAIGWATVLNNPTRTTYTLGWTNRGTLTYNDYTEAF